jgi:uncharacterized protein YeaO (DUF488 family)
VTTSIKDDGMGRFGAAYDEDVAMQSKLKLTTFQIGSAPRRGQGLRIGATRHPPRGVPKGRWQRDGYFDVWLPVLAPSAKLISRYRPKLDDPDIRAKFFDSYERELLGAAESRQTVELIAQIAMRTPVSVGCFCEDEAKCHRSRLYEIVRRQAHELGAQ